MKKLIIIPIMFLMCLVGALALGTIVFDPTNAADYGYVYPATNILIYCNATPDYGYAVKNVTLYMSNASGKGTWTQIKINDTGGAASIEVQRYFNFTGTDGQYYKYGCRGGDNSTVGYFYSPNQTIYIENPPIVTLGTATATSDYKTTQPVKFNWTVTSATTTGTTFNCKVYFNETGSFNPYVSTFLCTNNTVCSFTRNFPTSESAYKYAVQCSEYSNVAIINITGNRTFYISGNTFTATSLPATDTYFNTVSDVNLSVTATGSYVHSCNLYTNVTGTFALNRTSRVSSGNLTQYPLTAAAGSYVYSFICNDTTSRSLSTANKSIHLDTTKPGVTGFYNYTTTGTAGYCDSYVLNITFNEPVIMRLTYGLTAVANTSGTSNTTTYSKSALPRLSFGYNRETIYYVNVSSFDRAGNNNMTQYTVRTPVGICSGWNYYAWYGLTSMNLSAVATQTGADYVYFFNSSSQEWMYWTSGVTTYESYTPTINDTLAFYKTGSSIWWRNLSTVATPPSDYSIKAGDNYMPVKGLSYTFYNLSEAFNASTSSTMQWVYFSAFNNSNQHFVSYVSNTSWNNASVLTRAGLEVIWFYSSVARTFNMTNVR